MDNKKNIMVFGATGLVGVYLVDDLIEHNYGVFAIGNKRLNDKYYSKRNIPHAQVDISDINSFSNIEKVENIDTVVILSAIMPASMEGYHPQKYFEINTIGTLNILEYCRKNGIKNVIYLQSHSDLSGHWGEKDRISPYATRKINYNNDHTVYVISKCAAMDLLEHYHQAYNFTYSVFRCPNIYAYYPKQYFYVDGKKTEIGYRKIINQAINSETIEIWGECKTAKDIVYVKDLTQMILKAIEVKPSNSVYNVSTGHSTTLEEQILGIIDVFSPESNKSKVVYRPEKKVHINNHQYDISNAIEELNYCPQYDYITMLHDYKKEMQNDRFKELLEN